MGTIPRIKARFSSCGVRVLELRGPIGVPLPLVEKTGEKGVKVIKGELLRKLGLLRPAPPFSRLKYGSRSHALVS
jgi:hypothetical protein